MLRRGLPGEPRTLDPQLADDDFSFQIVRDIYEGLTAEDSYGQIVPGAASSWTVDDSGTVYTFSLRPDAKWSNGDRILASEFVEGMRRAVDPATASGSAGLLSVIKGASEIIAGRKKASDLAVTAVGDATGNAIAIRTKHHRSASKAASNTAKNASCERPTTPSFRASAREDHGLKPGRDAAICGTV